MKLPLAVNIAADDLCAANVHLLTRSLSQARGADEAAEQPLIAPGRPDRGLGPDRQFRHIGRVRRLRIDQHAALVVAPGVLVGVEFRGVGRQRFGPKRPGG